MVDIPAWWLLLALACGFALQALAQRQAPPRFWNTRLQQTDIQLAVAEEKLAQLKNKENECLSLQQQVSRLKTRKRRIECPPAGAA